MAKQDNYRQLIKKLDQFIRKYYLNKMIRGILYSVGLVLTLFLLVSILEHNFYFSPAARKGFLLGFIGLNGLALAYWVFYPLSQYFKLGRVISHEQAAEIIGDHFANVQDKLLNILQLKAQSESQQDNGLLLAGIDQKAEQISLVPFRSAIDLRKNRKYARYALPPLLILLVLLLAAPSIITNSTYRLINTNTDFERPAPFSFELLNEDLQVIQYENFSLEVKINGEQLPNEVYVEVEGFPYRMRKQENDRFVYQFNNVQKDMNFRVVSDPISSSGFTLEVLPKPNILGFEVSLDYPGYTGRKDERLANIGDLSLPVGTRVGWSFEASHTDTIWAFFSGNGQWKQSQRKGEEFFSLQKRVMRSELYRLFVSNQFLPKADSVTYSISVIPDRYPAIEAEEFVDSALTKVLFFAGEASDDYGLLNLSFNYNVTNASGAEGDLKTIKLPNSGGKKIAFDHLFDLNELDLKPGEKVTYYFEVYDNDCRQWQ